MPRLTNIPKPGRLIRWLTPSLLDVFFCALLFGFFTQPHGIGSLLSDGDTGWHIRTGELVLRSGSIPESDPFSFSLPRQTWFAWEWLADVAFALLWVWRGLAGVAVFSACMLGLAATALLARLLRQGSGLWIGLAVALAAVSASSIHYLARPHVFSILFYTFALWLVAEDRDRNGPLVWVAVPITALWVNLHGGFVAWLVTLGLLVVECATRRAWHSARRYCLLALLCALASLANPHGWRLHVHVAGYLNSSWIMDHVSEFQSPLIRSESMIVFAILLLAAVSLVSRADRFSGVLVLFWGFLALRSARHIPFFAIVAAPVVASAAANCWSRLAARAPRRAPVRVFWDLAGEFGSGPRVSLWLPAVAMLAILTASGASFPADRFPVRAVERNLPQLTPGEATPRILTSDQWADYLIYRLYPRQRVFFDGRSDFFGPAIGADYRKLMSARGEWRAVLERYGFELALLPRDWALSTMLELEPAWQRIYEDPVSVLYARRSGAATQCHREPTDERTAAVRGVQLP